MESSLSTTLLWTVLVVALVIFALRGVKQVPQSKVLLVERLGKYHRSLSSGINFIIPILDSCPHEVIDISEQQIPISNQNVTTADNVRLVLNLQAFYRIKDAAQFKYRIEDGKGGVRTTIDATVRALVGRRTLDQLNADRLQIASEIADEVRSTANEWGVAMHRVEITDVTIFDPEFANAMRLQAQAERARRGTVIDAEANAQSILLTAEAEAQKVRLEADAVLYKAQKDAEAIRVTAEAQAWAWSTKGATLQSAGAQIAQEGEILKEQIRTLGNLGSADNAKIIVIPSDLVQAASSFGHLFQRK